MLHMILGILKVIGIIAGILILLLLAAVLAVLFVPVRYRVQAAREAECLQAEARISWLFRLVSLQLTAVPGQQPQIAVRLFGIRLPLFDDSSKSGAGGAGGRKGKLPRGKIRSSGKKKEKAEEERTLDPRKEEAKPAEKEKAAEERTPEPQVQKTPQLLNQDAWQAELERPWKPETERAEDEPQEEPRAGRAAEAFQRICGRLRALADRLQSLGERIAQLGRRIIALPETIRKQIEKVVGLLKKPGELLEQLTELEAQEAFGSVFGYLTELIVHYKPRSIEGYLHFGTGDPAMTGWLTGLVYLLLPARAERFSVEPEFTEKVLETKLICAGYLRACHLLRAGWKALRNKKLRTFINAVRKRGE